MICGWFLILENLKMTGKKLKEKKLIFFKNKLNSNQFLLRRI